MSGKIMGQVWDLDIPHAEMLVLLAMTDHADHLGRNIRPSVGLVSWKTGYSVRQVQRVIKTLIDRQLLLVEKSPQGDVVHYRANLDVGPFKAPYKSKKMQGCQNVTPDIAMSGGGVTQLCQGGGDTAMSPKPSVKPSVKPPPPETVDQATPGAAVASGGGGVDQESPETIPVTGRTPKGKDTTRAATPAAAFLRGTVQLASEEVISELAGLDLETVRREWDSIKGEACGIDKLRGRLVVKLRAQIARGNDAPQPMTPSQREHEYAMQRLLANLENPPVLGRHP